MTESHRPIVRLKTASGTKKPANGAVPKADVQNSKLAVRLNEGINEALRNMIRYRGDLSAMSLEALASVDLTREHLVSVNERMVRDTTITVPRAVHEGLKRIATDRRSSMNILVNTALAHWLAKKGAVRLR